MPVNTTRSIAPIIMLYVFISTEKIFLVINLYWLLLLDMHLKVYFYWTSMQESEGV